MANDTRQFKFSILDDVHPKPWECHYLTGVEDLVRKIRETCERYGMENSDPDPDQPFILRIERMSDAQMDHETWVAAAKRIGLIED